jgi:hypothetical protein
MGAVLCLIALLAGTSSASAQMPDVRQMSGIPRPVDDLPNGSVSVRVIRGDMSHNLENQRVEMRAGNTTRTVNTDAEGRAQFDNIDAGTPVKFSTVVDGERLESQEFAVQPRGGARLLLVATDPNAAKDRAARGQRARRQRQCRDMAVNRASSSSRAMRRCQSSTCSTS